VSLYEWLLFIHLLGAAAIFAAIVLFAAGLVTVRSGGPDDAAALRNLARIGGVLFDVGGTLVLVFGIWLVFEAPGDYGILDAWVIAAIVFWVIAAASGTRARNAFVRRPRATGDDVSATEIPNRATNLMFGVAVLAVLVMLLLMVFKPGAG
jgi:uncharacterized membrane protein